MDETRTAQVPHRSASPSAATAAATRGAPLLHPPLPQAFSLLGALGEAEDIDEVDTDALAPEPEAEEDAPRMPQRPKRVRSNGACQLLPALLVRPGCPCATIVPAIKSFCTHSCKSFHSQSFIHLFACPFPATQPAAPPKPRPPPDVSDRLTLDDRKFTRMCVAGWDARLALRICLALQWLADSAVTKEQGCSGEREGGPYA